MKFKKHFLFYFAQSFSGCRALGDISPLPFSSFYCRLPVRRLAMVGEAQAALAANHRKAKGAEAWTEGPSFFLELSSKKR